MKAAARFTAGWLFLLLMAAAMSGCWKSCDPHSDVLASVVSVSGGVLQKDEYAPPITWQSVGAGAQARAGDALRTDDQATAVLTIADGSSLTLQPASLLRFRPAQAGQEPEFDLLSGEAFVQSGDKELPLHTSVGVAHLRPGARLQLTRSDNELHLLLQVGEATFRTLDGKDVELKRGESLKLEIGAAIIRETADNLATQVRPGNRRDTGLTLEVPQGGVKARGPHEQGLRALPDGTSPIVPGSTVSVAAGSRAILHRQEDSIVLFGEGDYRITNSGPLVSTKQGKLHVLTKSQDIVLVVPGGKIHARAADGGSEADLDVGKDSARLDVLRGVVTWIASAGSSETQVTPGAPLEWSLPETTAEPSDEGNNNTAHPEPADSSQRTAPAHPSFVVSAGESFVVHAASLPVALGVSAPDSCTGEALVELNGGARYRGTGVVKLWIDAATHSYSTRCASSPAKSSVRGSVRVLEDAGTRKLPARPPMSNVEADGRGYTIYYQNQPPDIHVRWPNAPDTKAYQLDVDGNVRKLDAPEHTFASGELSDGQHRLTFSALSRRSRTTAVEVRFDNNAATASLNAPQDRGFAAGTEVAIEGVVLPAWKVSVDGGTIEKVGDSRFSGLITTSETRPDFAVRLSHRKLGIHYYLRRAAE